MDPIIKRIVNLSSLKNDTAMYSLRIIKIVEIIRLLIITIKYALEQREVTFFWLFLYFYI